MRKYWRLVLVVATVISCIFMLVYRKKYDNLNAVLVLMNIFKGKTVTNSTLCHRNESTVPSQSNLINELVNPNHWNGIFSGIYVYSSHFVLKKVISLGYNSFSATELKDISCKLWYENHNISVKSTFEIYALNEQIPTLFYTACIPPFDLGIPYAVTFVKKDVSTSMPVHYKQPSNISYTACVKPLSSIFFDTYKILEFVLYHSYIGIKHFILYYTVMSSSVKRLLISISAECGVHVELLPWNTPPGFGHEKFQLESYAINCIFHMSTQNHTNFLFLLDLDHFIFLGQKPSNLNQLISDTSQFDFSKFQNQMFCSEFPNNIFAQNLNIHFKTLLKTKMLNEAGQQINVIYNINRMRSIMYQNKGFKNWLQTRSLQKYNVIKKSAGVIFSYTECGLNISNKNIGLIFTENDEMWKFKNLFYKNCIYVLSKNVIIKD